MEDTIFDEGNTGTVNTDGFGYPCLIDTIVKQDSIELVYRRDPLFSYTVSEHVAQPDPKIFKVIYSCKNKKWHQSERIEGSFVGVKDETYQF